MLSFKALSQPPFSLIHEYEAQFLNYFDFTVVIDTATAETMLVSYTIPEGVQKKPMSSCIKTDVRLFNQNCPSLAPSDYNFYYHPELAKNNYANFKTNLIKRHPKTPTNDLFHKLWNKLTGKYLQTWAQYDTLQVVTGPIFDYNYDNLYDRQGYYDSDSPTHYFFVAKKIHSNEVISFILPNYAEEFTCNLRESHSFKSFHKAPEKAPKRP